MRLADRPAAARDACPNVPYRIPIRIEPYNMAEVATSRSSFWLARSLLYLLRMRAAGIKKWPMLCQQRPLLATRSCRCCRWRAIGSTPIWL
jgi:hypothetical protein